jgi:hypothetical protein
VNSQILRIAERHGSTLAKLIFRNFFWLTKNDPNFTRNLLERLPKISELDIYPYQSELQKINTITDIRSLNLEADEFRSDSELRFRKVEDVVIDIAGIQKLCDPRITQLKKFHVERLSGSVPTKLFIEIGKNNPGMDVSWL